MLSVSRMWATEGWWECNDPSWIRAGQSWCTAYNDHTVNPKLPFEYHLAKAQAQTGRLETVRHPRAAAEWSKRFTRRSAMWWWWWTTRHIWPWTTTTGRGSDISLPHQGGVQQGPVYLPQQLPEESSPAADHQNERDVKATVPFLETDCAWLGRFTIPNVCHNWSPFSGSTVGESIRFLIPLKRSLVSECVTFME